MRGFLEIVGVILGIIAVILVISLGIVTPIDMYLCNSYEKGTGIRTKYTGLTCFVQQVDGNWISMQEHRPRLRVKGE